MSDPCLRRTGRPRLSIWRGGSRSFYRISRATCNKTEYRVEHQFFVSLNVIFLWVLHGYYLWNSESSLPPPPSLFFTNLLKKCILLLSPFSL